MFSLHRTRGRLLPPLISALCFLLAPPGSAQNLTFTLEDASHPLFSLAGLQLNLSLAGGAADLAIQRMRVGDADLGPIRLHCADLRISQGSIDCVDGLLLAGKSNSSAVSVSFSYRSTDGRLEAVLNPRPGERWKLSGQRERLELELQSARIDRVTPFVQALRSFNATGDADGRIVLTTNGREQNATIDLRLHNARFHDQSGDRAGEKLSGSVRGELSRKDPVWRWSADVRWDSGELYLKPFYFSEGGHRAWARGSAAENRVVVDAASIDLAGAGRADGRLEWDRKRSTLVAADFSTDEIDLDRAGRLLVKPLIEQQGLPGIDLAGKARVSGAWDNKGLKRLDVVLTGAGASGPNRTSSLYGVTGVIPWRRDEAAEAQIRVSGGSFSRLPLGPFNVPLRMHGTSFRVPRAEIPLLDGAVVVEGLELGRSGETWQWQVGGALYPVSMPRVTQALGLPTMQGSLSASIPRVFHDGSTIRLDGALIIQVFDGYIAANNLRLSDPFGRLPHLEADLDIRHIDLGQLTETFSFGSITGYVDGAVKNLELVGWKPQRFDARIESSPGDYRKRISQRAVENISALGGAGATAAIQRSVLRFFDEFGYSRLGFSCRLLANVCRMNGVEPAPQGYVIVKGGGVPAINVIGYNRNVDWEELVSRLQRITAGNKPIIE